MPEQISQQIVSYESMHTSFNHRKKCHTDIKLAAVGSVSLCAKEPKQNGKVEYGANWYEQTKATSKRTVREELGEYLNKHAYQLLSIVW